MKKRYDLKNLHRRIPISLGSSKFNKNHRVIFIERLGFGVHIIGATTRYGKSIIVTNIMTAIGQYRPVIILDYLGEHHDRRYPNFLSADYNTGCLQGLTTYTDFHFKIGQFHKTEDWLSLQFPERASQLMANLASRTDAHRNDPHIFWQLLEDVPITYGMVDMFEKKYGFYLPNVNSATVESAKTQYNYLLHDNFFGDTDDPTYDFGELSLRNHHININFNLDKSEMHKARAIAGKVLEQIERVIDVYTRPPLIVIEEADVLAPELREQEPAMSSLKMLIKFVLKLQKKQVELIFIVQDLRNLNHSIVGNYHTMILGQLPPNNPHFELTKRLRWDIDRNYREFLYLRKGVPGYEVFVPEDVATMY